MKIAIMNRTSVERMARKPFPEKTAVISIVDSDAPPVAFLHKPSFLLPMVFDDMQPESGLQDELLKDFPEFRRRYRIMTDQQADEIVQFARDVYENADLLICQCEFGQSRSAAIAAAIMEYFGRSGAVVFRDKRYSPNQYVFEKVLEKLRRSK